MAKKTESPEPVATKGRRKSPWVVCGEGVRQRFLRGMVTHDLVQRGLSFDDAYAVARAVRDRLEGREEVTTAEIRDLIREQLEGMYGPELPTGLGEPAKPVVTFFQAANPVGELSVIDAETVQDCGVQVADLHRVADNIVPIVVGLPMLVAAANTTTS